MAETLATLTGWLLFAALVLALGGVGARLVVLPQAGRVARELAASRRGPPASWAAPSASRAAPSASAANLLASESDPASRPAPSASAANPLASESDPASDAGPPTPAAAPPSSLAFGPSMAETLADSAARIGLAGAALLPLALGGVFVRQLLEFRDPFVPWQADARLLLLGTAWGDVWLAAACVSLVGAGGFVLAARGQGAGWWIGAPAALALGAFPALTGHASGTGALRWLTVPADVLHVWAAGFWVGGLAFVLHADHRVRRANRRRDPHGVAPAPGATASVIDAGADKIDAGAAGVAPAHAAAAVTLAPEAAAPKAHQGALPLLVPAFSPLAVACVATLVLTGALASWIHLPEPLSPLASLSGAYGRTLGVKLLLALVVFGLGATNWRHLTPRLREPDGEHALRRTALVELGVAQLVLLVTALLVRTAP